ncbi:MAG: LysM peptidoglycan-binding domain-containing protein, partial [Desulfobacterota bacterium]|nr:LysM peptidoglycan-binding domain-containing protein [Thermodesulfobacteriota bacterium]
MTAVDVPMVHALRGSCTEHIQSRRQRGRQSFFKLLTGLAYMQDTDRLRAWQAVIDELGLRYCVTTVPGRLEFLADLIIAGHHLLSPTQKRKLRRSAARMLRAPADKDPFADFASAYVVAAFDRTVPQQPSSRLSKALAAASLMGMLTTACAQKNQSAAVPAVQPPVIRTTPVGQQSPAHEYIVQPGESVFKIARKTGVDPEALVRLNKLSYNHKRRWYELHPGQVLRLPATKDEAVRDQNIMYDSIIVKDAAGQIEKMYHLVHRGETLGSIAKKYNVDVNSLAAANGIVNPHRIRYGTMLHIPRPASAKPAGRIAFKHLPIEQKVAFLAERTIPSGRPYLKTLVEVCDEFNVDPRLFAALVWEESWFQHHAISQDNCRGLVQIDPRFHSVSSDIRTSFQKSLRYLMYEYTYYLRKGFDRR